MRVILDLDTLKSFKNGIVYIAFNYNKHWYEHLDQMEKKVETVKIYSYYDTLMRHLGVEVKQGFQEPILVWIVNGKAVCYIQQASLNTIYRITNNYIYLN